MNSGVSRAGASTAPKRKPERSLNGAPAHHYIGDSGRHSHRRGARQFRLPPRRHAERGKKKVRSPIPTFARDVDSRRWSPW